MMRRGYSGHLGEISLISGETLLDDSEKKLNIIQCRKKKKTIIYRKNFCFSLYGVMHLFRIINVKKKMF